MRSSTFIAAAVVAAASLSYASPQQHKLPEKAHLLVPRSITTSAPTCSFTPVKSPPPLLHCGDQGTLKRTKVLGTPSKIPKSVSNPIVQCESNCFSSRSDVKCQSFSYNTHTRLCTLYTTTIDKQGFKQSTNGIVYYNRACFKIHCPPTPTTTSTSSSPTSTSGPVCTPVTTQYIVNPSFENTTTPFWSFTSTDSAGSVGVNDNPGDAYDGSYYADIILPNQPGTSLGYVSQSPPSLPNAYGLYVLYHFRVPSNTFGNACGFFVNMDSTQIDSYRITGNEDPSSYITRSATYPPGYNPSTLQLGIDCYNQPTTAEVYLDLITITTPEQNCPFTLQFTPQDNSTASPGYLVVTNNQYVATATSSPSSATTFTLASNGYLLSTVSSTTYSAYALAGSSSQVYFNGPSDADNADNFQFGINDEQSPSILDAGSINIFYYCPASSGIEGLNYVNEGQASPDSSCIPVVLSIVY